MKHYEFWFVVGSQTLYGDDVLTTVANRAEEMAQKLSAVLPYPLKYKVTAKSSAEITQVVKEANYDDNCAGIVTWCHTFSPSKMWINGLDLLQKPWLHFATQYNREIPNEEIDMDFMNLNQAAHGDREHGFIGATTPQAAQGHRRLLAGRRRAGPHRQLDEGRHRCCRLEGHEGHALRRQYAQCRRHRGR